MEQAQVSARLVAKVVLVIAGGACIISGIALIVLRKRHKTVSTRDEQPELLPKP